MGNERDAELKKLIVELTALRRKEKEMKMSTKDAIIGKFPVATAGLFYAMLWFFYN